MSDHLHESYNSQPNNVVAFYPDLSDPIDTRLNDFREAVAQDYLPSARQQRNLITGIQQKDADSARQLLAVHDGLIAAVTYPFKHYGIASSDLLIIGRKTLLQSALTYHVNGEDDFSDRAIVAMEDALCKATHQEPVAGIAVRPDFRPMDRMVNFVSSLKEVEAGETIFPPDEVTRQLVGTLASRLAAFKYQKAACQIAGLSPVQRLILPLLPYVPASEIAQKANFSRGSFTRAVKLMMNELGVDTKPELVLVARSGGMPFDIKTPPIEELTLRERQVGFRLFKPNREIAAELGMTKYAVDYTAQALIKKTGVKTRMQALLMAQAPGFEPTPQEIRDAQPSPGLEGFTCPQADVLQRLHLTYQTISEELDRSTEAIDDMASKLRSKFGVTTNAAMALEMHKRGVVYDIKVPNRPLGALLNSEVMEVAENVVDSNATIAKNLGLDPKRVHYLVNYARRQTAARTRAELVLIVKKFDTGERREKADNRARKQILAERLGLKTLDDCDIDALLAGVTPQQRQILTLYYLADEAEQPKTWTDIKKELGIHNPASPVHKAVKQMRKSLGTDTKNNDQKISK